MDHEPQKPIDLKLDTHGGDIINPGPVPDGHVVQKKSPIIGWFAVGCGILGLFTASILFVPLTLIFSIIALFMGQFIWALGGVLLAIIGFLTSPQLLLIVGLGALASYFGL